MPLGIPLPGLPADSLLQGMNTGSAMMARMLQPAIERQKMLQQQKQFEQDLALRKAAQSLAAQRLKYDQDPMRKINEYKALEDYLKSQSGKNPIPTEQYGQGMGMFSPEGLVGAKQDAQSQNNNGIDFDLLRQNILRGFLKKEYGVDPMADKDAVYHGPARDAYDLERLRKEVGENSPVYQNALQAYKASQQGKEDLSGIRNRTLGGLKPGERWINDESTGEVIGKEIPLTATERDEYKGRGFFNHVFPYISSGLTPISGKGSINKFEDAASQYKTNPQAKKMVDDWLLAKKLLTAGVVKESATLGSGKQKATYAQLRDSLNSSDIPDKISSIIKQFQLPPEAAALADQRFQQILNEATKKGEQSVPAYQKNYFNPEKYQAKQNKSEKNNAESNKKSSSETKTINGKTYKKIDGDWYETD